MTDELRPILLMPAVRAARRLLGMELRAAGAGGLIVEVEAYTQDDPASHSYAGESRRNRHMFLEGGHIYVYRSYGVHWCLNLVTGPAGRGEAVLIRALEPVLGLEAMRARRPGVPDARLCSGPGNVTRALGITGALSGEPLGGFVDLIEGERPRRIHAGMRVGITRATDRRRRFCVLGSRSLSRPPRRTRER